MSAMSISYGGGGAGGSTYLGYGGPDRNQFSAQIDDVRRTVEMLVRLKGTPTYPAAVNLTLQLLSQLGQDIAAFAPIEVSL